MRSLIIYLCLVASLGLASTGCLWGPPKPSGTIAVPVIPVDKYPTYTIPESLDTDGQKTQVVDALFQAEKYAQVLKARVEKYNQWAKAKNTAAEDLFKE
jgi:hypothetical protein